MGTGRRTNAPLPQLRSFILPATMREIKNVWVKSSSTSLPTMPLLSRGFSCCLVGVFYGLLKGYSLFGGYTCIESWSEGIAVDARYLSSQSLPIPLHVPLDQ